MRRPVSRVGACMYLGPVRHLGDGGDKRDALLLILLEALQHGAVDNIATHGYNFVLLTGFCTPLCAGLSGGAPCTRRRGG